MKRLGFYQRTINEVTFPTTMWVSINNLAEYLFEAYELNAKDVNDRIDVAVECYRMLKAEINEFAKGTLYETYSESEKINGIAKNLKYARSESSKFGNIELRKAALPANN